MGNAPTSKELLVAEFVIPESLALCADLLYTTRQTRLEIKKQVEALEAREQELREHLIRNLPSDGSKGVAGQIAQVLIVKKDEPQVEDWEAFYNYIYTRKAWDLLQRRVSAPAVKARWEDQQSVDGVGHFMKVDLSLKKV
jgi:hypothetical protein